MNKRMRKKTAKATINKLGGTWEHFRGYFIENKWVGKTRGGVMMIAKHAMVEAYRDADDRMGDSCP
jgi:hypothetical protein